MKFTIHYEDDNNCEVYSVGQFDSEPEAVAWLRKVFLPRTVGCEVSQGDGWMTVKHPTGVTAELYVHPFQTSEEFLSIWNVGEIEEAKQADLL